MTARAVRTLCVVAACCACSAAATAGEAVRLFDGKSLDGWTKVGGGASYRVEEGAIVGEVGPGPNTFLRTDREYADFELELDVKLDVPGNSGIQFRSHQQPGANGRVFGYQFEIDPSDRAWTGGIYDESRRGWLYPLAGHPEAQKAFRKDDWNHVRVVADGPALKTWVNGVPCADLVDTADDSGFIALQVHAAKEGRIRWKNITLRDLGGSRYRPLWDGKDLAAWTPSGGGHWSVEGGAIHGTSSREEARHGHLFSRGVGPHFALRLKFRAVKGDSGVYFRASEGGKSGVTGLQANIDPEKDTGGLYEIDGRGWLARPKADDLKKWLRPGEWNDLAVVVLGDARGERVVVQVNGHTTAELRDAALARTEEPGRIALQVHAGQDVDVWFKDLELREVGPRGGKP